MLLFQLVLFVLNAIDTDGHGLDVLTNRKSEGAWAGKRMNSGRRVSILVLNDLLEYRML